MIANDQKLPALELRSQLPAAFFALRAEITQMIHKIIFIYGFIPSSYDLTVHCFRVRKGSFLIESYILISEMSIRDDKDAGLFFIVFLRISAIFRSSSGSESDSNVGQRGSDCQLFDAGYTEDEFNGWLGRICAVFMPLKHSIRAVKRQLTGRIRIVPFSCR